MIRGTAKMSLRASLHVIGLFDEKYLCQMISFCPKQGLIALQLNPGCVIAYEIMQWLFLAHDLFGNEYIIDYALEQKIVYFGRTCWQGKNSFLIIPTQQNPSVVSQDANWCIVQSGCTYCPSGVLQSKNCQQEISPDLAILLLIPI